MLDRLRTEDDTARWAAAALVLTVVVALPLVASGPGNDLDVGNIFRSGRAIARHLSYVPSRAPGAPVHESVVGALDLLGGPLLTNLASLVAAAALLVGLDRLLEREGVGTGRRWALAVLAANPWFVIAATSTADYLFALAFVVWAAVALRADRTVLAGVLAAASMGSRIGSALLVGALLLAELTEPDRAGSRRRVLTTGFVAAASTVVLFIPSVVAARGLAFAQNDFSTSSPLVQLGRAAAKDLTLLGPIGSLVALVTLPAVVAALKTWRSSWLIRFAVPGFILSQLLFIRFPWKMPHLLPCLLTLVLVLAVALADRPRLLIGLAALQLLFCVVQVQVIAPDNPNEATGGTVEPAVGWGPVATDWQCRREHRDAYRGRQQIEIEAAWDCAKPFGG